MCNETEMDSYIQQAIDNEYAVRMHVRVFNMVNVTEAEIIYTDSEGNTCKETALLPVYRERALPMLQRRADKFGGLVEQMDIKGSFGGRK